MTIKNSLTLLLFVVVLCFCFSTVALLVRFLSSHDRLHIDWYGKIEVKGSMWWQLITDIGLIVLFFVQHFVQSKQLIKDFVTKVGLGVFERLLYNLGTCVVLMTLMLFWQSTNMTVWNVSTSHSNVHWWIFTVIHCLSWLSYYSSWCIMDPPELLGIRQLHNSIGGYPDPLSRKTPNLCRLYSHMRHGSFSALLVILFAHPVMQLDRLVFGGLLLVVVLFWTRVDEEDYQYQKRWRLVKEASLHALQ